VFPPWRIFLTVLRKFKQMAGPDEAWYLASLFSASFHRAGRKAATRQSVTEKVKANVEDDRVNVNGCEAQL